MTTDLYAEGYRAGYNEGHRDGMAQARAEDTADFITLSGGRPVADA